MMLMAVNDMMFCVTAGAGTKPAGKGIDMDAVGNINGVPVYEFDLDGLKVEDKPWRKPGMLCSSVHLLIILPAQSKPAVVFLQLFFFIL